MQGIRKASLQERVHILRALEDDSLLPGIGQDEDRFCRTASTTTPPICSGS